MLTLNSVMVQEGVEPEKVPGSEKTVKSRAILPKSVPNGIVPEQVRVNQFYFCWLISMLEHSKSSDICLN